MRWYAAAIVFAMSQTLFLGCGPSQDEHGAGGHAGAAWSKRFGGKADEESIFVAVDGAGNVLLAGTVEGEIDLGGGPLPPVSGAGSARDVYLAKLDAQGKHVWSKRVGDAQEQACGGMALDATGDMVLVVFVRGTADFGGGPLGSPDGRYYVLKLDPAGKQEWASPLGDGPGFTPFEIALDPAGNILLTGELARRVDFGGGPLGNDGMGDGIGDGFVVKLDPQGRHVWSKGYGSRGQDELGTHVVADAAGNVLLSGNTTGVVDLGGGPLGRWGVDSTFLAKLDPDGNHIYSKSLGAEGTWLSFNLAVDPAGDTVLAGLFDGTVDLGGGPLTSTETARFFAARLDPLGRHLQSKLFTGDAPLAPSVAVSGDGHVLLTGPFDHAIDFGGGELATREAIAPHADVFFAELDDDLEFVSAAAFPDVGKYTDNQFGTQIAPTPSRNVILGGYFSGSVDFGDGPLESAGLSDLFVVSHPR